MPDSAAQNDLAQLLAVSDLAQAAAALAAVREGWGVELSGQLAACQQLLEIYEHRHRGLLSHSSAHARQLASDVDEFVSRLRDHSSDRACIYTIRGKAEHHFVVFRLNGSDDLLGCFRLVSQLDVSPARWKEYWDVPA